LWGNDEKCLWDGLCFGQWLEPIIWRICLLGQSNPVSCDKMAKGEKRVRFTDILMNILPDLKMSLKFTWCFNIIWLLSTLTLWSWDIHWIYWGLDLAPSLCRRPLWSEP
jgi:hypothetical protein